MNSLPFNQEAFRKAMGALLAGRKAEHPDTLRAVESWMSSGKEGLILMGNVGTGKTTIASALARAWADYLTIAKVYRCDWIAEKIKEDESYVYEVSGNRGLVVLDDFGTESKVYGEERLPSIFYRRYEAGMPTVITTNLTSDQIRTKYGERIADRLRTYSKIVMNYKSLRK